ncbi:hypothetical protein LWI29_008908 [Acer saccharum]|uniref:Retroviral polymerase SH3-like domain-containing protein n=1 Tax=Acer saccharum TaxID=4024 RepID=A0AA39RCT0_ACESA|nr:hypothetical protein LWI29_008908 [Acer saccharum]
MQALLGNLGLDEALEGESKMPSNYSKEKKKNIMKRAYNTYDKLEPRARRCMFLGYPDGVKGFKLLYQDGSFSNCFNSRDAMFKENEMFMKKFESLESLIHRPSEKDEIEVELFNNYQKTDSSQPSTSQTGDMDNFEEETYEDQEALRNYRLARD